MPHNPSSERPSSPQSDVVIHLRRLGLASSAAEVIRELESLRPSLGTSLRLSALALPSLTALAEAHLRERLENASDALTGVLNAEAFTEAWRAHAELGVRADCEAVAVFINLSGAGEPARDRVAGGYLKTLADTCAEAVAADDFVGRVASTTIAVMPRNGGARGARTVADRLAEACRVAFAGAPIAFHLQIELRDLTGAVRERLLIAAGAQS